MFEDILSKDEFTREDLVILYTIKTLNELVDIGIMEGKPFELTEKGLEAIKDFEPTEEELKFGVNSLKVGGYIG